MENDKFWAWLSGLVFLLVAVSWFTFISPKLEMCRIYYSEMSTYGCYMSAIGLPIRGKQ